MKEDFDWNRAREVDAKRIDEILAATSAGVGVDYLSPRPEATVKLRARGELCPPPSHA